MVTMKRMKNIITIGLIASVVMSAACNATDGEGSGETALMIVPSMANGGVSADVHTRSRLTGTVFPINSSVGLSLTGDDAPGIYRDIIALNSGSAWNYFLSGTPAGTVLAGFSNWGTINIDGYYPYQTGLSGPPGEPDFSAIPFSVATPAGSDTAAATEEDNTATDYMVAKRVSKAMNSGVYYLSMKFYHLLTALDIRAQMAYDGFQVRLVAAKFTISDPRKFVVAGTYNAVNPDVSNMAGVLNPAGRTEVSTIDITYSSDAKIVEKDVITSPLLMIPELRTTDVSDDATITVTLTFNDMSGNHYQFEDVAAGEDPSYSFSLSSITNTGDAGGLLAGHVYALEVTVGTYVRFSGAPQIVQETIEDDDDPSHIDI